MIRNRQGVTLTELLTVITIISILVSIGTYTYAQYIKSVRLRKAIESIDADIRMARWIARTGARSCYIQFDPATNSYSIDGRYFRRLPDGIRFGYDSSVKGRPNSPYQLPPSDGISFDRWGSRNRANFYPSGVVSPAGSVFITDGNQTMAVVVAITGRPKKWRFAGGRQWVAF